MAFNKKFRPMSQQEKLDYSKRFSKSERIAYRKGKRNKWLELYHTGKLKSKKSNFATHKFTKKELDDLDKVKLV